MRTMQMGRRDLAGWAVLLGLTGVLFGDTIAGLYARWMGDPTYSHGILVPAISLFFIWDSRDLFKKVEIDGSMWGAAALAAAVGLLFVGHLGNMFFFRAAALIAALGAVSLLVGGWSFLKLAAFPILFLVFMCPLPSALYDPISAQLRLFASTVSTVLLQIMGVAATRTGNIIQLSTATLSVEDACSGIRSLFGITATATAFAFIMPGGVLRKVVFVVSAAPIAVVSNIMRVTGTGLLYRYAGEKFAQGFYHSLEGWVFYVLALAMFFGEYWLLSAAFPTGKAKEDSEKPQAEATARKEHK